MTVTHVVDLPEAQVVEASWGSLPRTAKSGLERAVSWAALFVLLIPFALLALAIRLDASGPVFFRQVRVGQHGRTFRVWKFRTMVTDAESQAMALAQANSYGPGPFFKVKDDPRVTRVGAVLRKTSLDELPQLINVAVGDMSLVGPRPITPTEAGALGEAGEVRLRVKPGLTGLWQVSGRSDTSWEDRLHLDNDYVHRWSLWLDLRILLLTIPAVLRGDGAC